MDLRGLSSFRTQKRNSRQLLKALFVKDKSNKVDRLCSIVEEIGFGRRSAGSSPVGSTMSLKSHLKFITELLKLYLPNMTRSLSSL